MKMKPIKKLKLNVLFLWFNSCLDNVELYLLV